MESWRVTPHDAKLQDPSLVFLASGIWAGCGVHGSGYLGLGFRTLNPKP